MAFQVHIERPSTGKIYEVAVIGDIQVSKSKNEPGSLTCSILRETITVENGDIIAVQLNEEGMDDFNLFYGYVWKTSKVYDEDNITAYDQLFALKQSKEIKVYGNISASDLFIRMADEHKLFMLDPPNVKDTEYVIPNVIADNSTLLDMMTDALNITYRATGKKYYIYDMFKNLCLHECEEFKLPKEEYELNVENIKSYTIDEDRTEYKNEIIVKSEETDNPELAVRRNEESISAMGAVTYTEKTKDKENADVTADTLFEEKQKDKKSLSVTVYGCNPQIVPGRLVHVDLFSSHLENIMGWFEVEDVTFTLTAGVGNMDLKLSIFDMEDEAWT